MRSDFSVDGNKFSDSSIEFLESTTVRNLLFAEHKPALLAFQLACRRRELHVANELWDVVAINFLLPLFGE